MRATSRLMADSAISGLLVAAILIFLSNVCFAQWWMLSTTAPALPTSSSAFDPLRNTTGQVTLSNGNLTATMTAAGTNDSVFTTRFHNTGKWVYRMAVGSCMSAISCGAGFASATAPSSAGSWLGIDAKSFAVYGDGRVWINGASNGNIGVTFTTGNVLDLAIDLDNKTIQIAKDGGSLSSTVSIAALSNFNLSPAGNLGANADALTFNGATPGSIAGFAVWDSAPSVSISSVAMSCGSSCSFTDGAPGTIGTASATLSSGSFSGSWSLKTSGVDHGGVTCIDYGSDFAINGSTGILSNGSGATSGSYPGVCVTATEAGIGGSPYTQAFTITGETAVACDQTLQRTITNQTIDDSVTNTTSGQNLDLARQVVVYTAAVPCGLSAGGPSAQYQVMSDGSLAFQTSLTNGQSRNISINDVLGNAYTIASPLSYSNTSSTQTISNEYYTVVLRKTQSDLTNVSSPVISITSLQNGVSLTGAFDFSVNTLVADGNLAAPGITSYTFEVLEQGPLVAKFKMTFHFHSLQNNMTGGICNNPGLSNPSVRWPDNPDGYASEIVEIRAGVNAVFFEEEEPFFWFYRYTVSGVNLTQIAYRGHDSADLAHGYSTDVKTGSPEVYHQCCFTASDPYVDALRDVSGGSPLNYDLVGNPGVFPWGPFARNGGRFEVAYDSGNSSTNWVGIAGGKAGRMLGFGGSGVTFVGNGTSFYVAYQAYGNGADLTCSRDNSLGAIRFPWALMTGGPGKPVAPYTSAPAPGDGGPFNENRPPPVAQTLLKNQNIDATLTKLLSWTPNSATETFSSDSLYLSPTQTTALFDKFKADPSCGAGSFCAQMCAKDPPSCSTFQYIANPTPTASNALLANVTNTVADIQNAFWFRNGYMEDNYLYLRGGEVAQRLTPSIPLIINDPNLTSSQRAAAYKAFLFLGNLFADRDFVPLGDGSTQFNFGNTNIINDYTSSTPQVMLPLSNNPRIRATLTGTTTDPSDLNVNVSSVITDGWNSLIAPTGEASASPHYISAGISNVLNLCQEALQNAVFDCATSIPQFENFAKFDMDLTTPPEIRFGGLRKHLTIGGDGPSEANYYQAQLGTMVAASNPTLSAKLMQNWLDEGSHQDSFFGSSVFKIDQDLPHSSAALGDGYYPGYMSVMRSGYGTANESAVWFLHGDFYIQSNHRHNNVGAVVFYLLGAPISVDWSSYFNPITTGALLGGGAASAAEVLADSGWDGSGAMPSLSVGGCVGGGVPCPTVSSSSSFAGNAPSATATIALDSGNWTRTVSLNRAQTTTPVVVIQDSQSTTNQVIIPLNLMATGAMGTPGGNVTPTIPTCTLTSLGSCGLAPPSCGTTGGCGPQPSNTGFLGNLASGWNQFTFTGQWGVDGIVMVYVPDGTSSYQLGAWVNNWQNSTEADEYLAANGTAYTEKQYQLRLWTRTRSKFVIVPYRHGSTVPTISTNGGTSITVNGNTIALNG